MRKHYKINLVCLLFLLQNAWAVIIVDPAQPITHTVTVNLIQVQDGPGGPIATAFGDAAQRADIESTIDIIWAQAGIDIEFSPVLTQYENDFAYDGNTEPRPTGDLNTIRTQAGIDGVLDPDPNVINLFFVEIVPGFSQTSDNTANGLAFVGGNGIAQHIGVNLLTFQNGRDVAASVVAHEIGHNLGLDHLVEAENLMQEGGAPNQGERLNASQITTALASNFAVENAVPEPSTYFLLMLLGIFGARRHYQKQAA